MWVDQLHGCLKTVGKYLSVRQMQGITGQKLYLDLYRKVIENGLKQLNGDINVYVEHGAEDDLFGRLDSQLTKALRLLLTVKENFAEDISCFHNFGTRALRVVQKYNMSRMGKDGNVLYLGMPLIAVTPGTDE